MKIRNTNLTEGVIWKQIVIFALPLLLSNLLQQLYSTVDLMIVGQFAGKYPMAAIGATGSVTNMMIGLFVGLAMGCSVAVALNYGSEDYNALYETVHTAYAVALAGGALLTLAGYFLTPVLLQLIGTPPEIFPHAVSYMRIAFYGIIPLLIYNMGSGILRSVGDSKRPFYFLVISSVVNIVLDLIFVAWFNWGINGAGWATVISQIVAAVMTTYSLTTAMTPYRLFLRDIRFHIAPLKRIFAIGVPAGLQSVLISVSNVLIQAKINSFGPDAIAGVAAASRVDGFVFTALQAYALAATTFAGQNIGAGFYHRLKRGLRSIMLLVILSGALFGTIGIVFGRQLIALFNTSPSVIEYGSRLVLLLSPIYWIFGLSEVFAGYIRGSGKSLPPMLITLIGMCLFRITWLMIALPIWPKIDTVFLSYPFSWTLTFILMSLYYKFGKWLPEIQVIRDD